jgi:hypothetical protein
MDAVPELQRRSPTRPRSQQERQQLRGSERLRAEVDQPLAWPVGSRELANGQGLWRTGNGQVGHRRTS